MSVGAMTEPDSPSGAPPLMVVDTTTEPFTTEKLFTTEELFATEALSTEEELFATEALATEEELFATEALATEELFPTEALTTEELFPTEELTTELTTQAITTQPLTAVQTAVMMMTDAATQPLSVLQPVVMANATTQPALPAAYTSGQGVLADSRYEVRMLGWNTPPEYMDYVSPHWKTFEAPNPFLHYMLGVFYIFFMFAALAGNGVVIWVFTSARSLRTPSNMFVINLAILDFIMMSKTPVFIINSFHERPVWAKIGCDVYALIGSYSGIGAAMTNAAIAYDRYKTIAKPFEPKMSRWTTFMMILGIWAYATPWSILPLLGIWGRYVPEGFLTTCSFDYLTPDENTRTFVGAIFFFAYVVPGVFIVYFYSQIFSHVRAHEMAMRAQAKKMNVDNLRSLGSKEDQEKSVEIRIAKVCMGLFFMFLVAWTPYAVISLIGAFGNRSVLTPLVSMLPALNCKLVACFDPWIYAINHPRYRLELQKRMPWFCIHEATPPDTTPSQSTDATEKA